MSSEKALSTRFVAVRRSRGGISALYVARCRTHVNSVSSVPGSRLSPFQVFKSMPKHQPLRSITVCDKQRTRKTRSSYGTAEDVCCAQGKLITLTREIQMENTSSSLLAHGCTLRDCEEHRGSLSIADREIEIVNEDQILDRR